MWFSVTFKEINNKIPITFNGYQGVQEGVEYYDGEYELTPKVESQTFQTAQKTMLDDLKVKAIPFFDVSNTSGGNTIYIGNEV